jgi:hypothetical protein
VVSINGHVSMEKEDAITPPVTVEEMEKMIDLQG